MVGQADVVVGLEEKALASGASKVYIEDLRLEFLTDYVPPGRLGPFTSANIVGTSFARPLIARRMVEIAELEGADAVAHGATGKGNDQVRFELTTSALALWLDIIAPWREMDDSWPARCLGLCCRAQCAGQGDDGTHLQPGQEPLASEQRRGPSKTPGNEPPKDMFEWTTDPPHAPDQPEYVEIISGEGFERVNGVAHGPVGIVQALNEIGARHGIGRGRYCRKSAGRHEKSWRRRNRGTLLYKGHAALEQILPDKATLHYKQTVSLQFADLVYNGQWFTPLRVRPTQFVNHTEQNVTGTVRLKLYKGSIILAGRKSPFSLYREDYVTFDQDDVLQPGGRRRLHQALWAAPQSRGDAACTGARGIGVRRGRLRRFQA
jgi:argininosuccinate synthase